MSKAYVVFLCCLSVATAIPVGSVGFQRIVGNLVCHGEPANYKLTVFEIDTPGGYNNLLSQRLSGPFDVLVHHYDGFWTPDLELELHFNYHCGDCQDNLVYTPSAANQYDNHESASKNPEYMEKVELSKMCVSTYDKLERRRV